MQGGRRLGGTPARSGCAGGCLSAGQRGVTILELLVVVMIAGIVLGISLGMLKAFGGVYGLNQAVDLATAGLRSSRLTAIREESNAGVYINSPARRIVTFRDKDADDIYDPNPDPNLDETIATYSMPSGVSIGYVTGLKMPSGAAMDDPDGDGHTCESADSTRNTVVYNPRGRRTNAMDCYIYIKDDVEDASHASHRAVAVDSNGSFRVWRHFCDPTDPSTPNCPADGSWS